MMLVALLTIAVLAWLASSPTTRVALEASWCHRGGWDHPEPAAPCGAPLAHRPRKASPRRAQRWAPSAHSRAEPRTGPSYGPSTASTARTRMTIESTAVPSPARWATCPLFQGLTCHPNPIQHNLQTMILG